MVSVSNFSGIELITVIAGETREPEAVTASAFCPTLSQLVFFYLCVLALMFAAVPWQ